ncbi:MAG: YtxH domain-containing protein [Pseudonocardiales bacterium]|nr:YtxH domain-containing protein [Pseudonocardiales bacterium]
MANTMTPKDKINGMVSQDNERAEPLLEKAESLVDKAKEKAESLLEKIEEKAESLLEKARDSSGKDPTF